MPEWRAGLGGAADQRLPSQRTLQGVPLAMQSGGEIGCRKLATALPDDLLRQATIENQNGAPRKPLFDQTKPESDG